MASSNEIHQASRPFVLPSTMPMNSLASTMSSIQSTPPGTTPNVSLPVSTNTATPGSLSRPTNIRAPSQPFTAFAPGPLNTHRVARRKSVTAGSQGLTSTAAAAVAAAMFETSPLALPVSSAKRQISALSAQIGRPNFATNPTPPSSLPKSGAFSTDLNTGNLNLTNDSRATSISNASTSPDMASLDDKARVRRASEGQPVSREGGKRFNRAELRCERCGKSYKHSSCLTKHLWEHTPEWQFTSKLLISKHQQVQLLEAARALVSMNTETKNDGAAMSPPDSVHEFVSESESMSDSATNTSDRSSSERTPPPLEGLGVKSNLYQMSAKRYSTSGISKAYRSPSGHRGSILSISPSNSSMGHGRKRSEDFRPSSSGRNSTGRDDRDLAAAVEQLTCSYGRKSKKIPKVTTSDMTYFDSYSSSGFLNSYPGQLPESFTRGSRSQNDDDATMGESDADSVMGFDDYEMRRAQSEEDDDGVFGRMEE